VTPNLDALVAAARRHPDARPREGLSPHRPARAVHVALDRHLRRHDRSRDRARPARGVRARRHLTVYDGIDCERSRPAAAPRCAASSASADAPGRRHRRPHPGWKGQDLVVQAMAQLRDRASRARCLIVGGVHRQGPSTRADAARIAPKRSSDA
jgi:glycosyltransferase involved in cell wall biosynthesis